MLVCTLVYQSECALENPTEAFTVKDVLQLMKGKEGM
jgi:hypothetical protein